jgi:hypothetical protein
MRTGHVALTLGLLALAVAPVTACTFDPVHQSLVDQLGPEAANIPKGPFHRAGQPCDVCHGGEGPASEQFSVAGTIFYGPNTTGIGLMGAGSVTVYIQDDNGQTVDVQTNCVGNFWITTSDFQPAFPLQVSIAGPNSMPYQKMITQIGREPSCGTCHQVQSGLSNQPNQVVNYYQTPGTIYLTGDDPKYQGDPTTCAMSPVNPPIPEGLGPVQP